MRSTAGGWDTPGAGCQPKLATGFTVWAVVILKLDILIYLQPALFPAPQRRTVNAALASGYCHRQLLFDHEAYRLSSRFR